jgi:hypothetical protein
LIIICICFILLIKSGSLVSEQYAPCRFECMSPTRLGYKELGLELVSLEDKISHTPKQPLMEGEKKEDGIGYPFKMLLKEALTQQRNNMMDSFAQIL